MIKKILAALKMCITSTFGTAPMLSVREDRVLLAITTPEYRRIMAQWSAIDRDRRANRRSVR